MPKFTMARTLFISTLLLILGYIRLAAGSIQYCHTETPQARFFFCTAINSWLNTSSSSVDWLITFGYQRSRPSGWGAIGLGSDMYGALMFVTYAKKSSLDELVLSVRRGTGYFEPRPSPELPEVGTLGISLNRTGWFEVSFACYGCGRWVLEDPKSNTQSWIWAVNNLQSFKEVSVESTIKRHGYYGYFELDMSLAQDNLETPTAPLIDPSIPNQTPRKTEESLALTFGLFAFHGALLAISIMVLYPFGVIAIRRSSRSSFKHHVSFQFPASVACLVGAMIALYGVATTGQVNGLRGLHILLGGMLLILILLQNALGYVHHKGFLLLKETPKITLGHVWLGRFIILGGCMNVALGLQVAGRPGVFLVFAFTLTFIDLVMLACVRRSSVQKHEILKMEDEDDHPFLELNGAESGD